MSCNFSSYWNGRPLITIAFREIVKSEADALKQGHDQVRQATRDLSTAFEAEPSDPAALQVALDHLSDARSHVDTIVKNIVVEANAKLSTDGRHRLAELTK